MKVYSLTQVGNFAEIGCYGVFSTPGKATQYAIDSAKEDDVSIAITDANSSSNSAIEETVWDGFTKKIYCGDYEFEIWEHNLDETD